MNPVIASIISSLFSGLLGAFVGTFVTSSKLNIRLTVIETLFRERATILNERLENIEQAIGARRFVTVALPPTEQVEKKA